MMESSGEHEVPGETHQSDPDVLRMPGPEESPIAAAGDDLILAHATAPLERELTAEILGRVY